MVIFNCGHYGSLSQMIVLRYKFHKNEKAILLVSEDVSKTGIYQALEDLKIFDKVIACKITIGCFELNNEEKVTQAICDYYQKLFAENAVDLANADKVYVSCDTLCPFGIFAYSKRIEYSMVEMFPGQFAVSGRYEAISEENTGTCKAYIKLTRKTSALSGDEQLAKEYIFVLPRPEDKNYSTQKHTIYLDFTKELSLLPNAVKEKILSIYNINRNDYHAIDTLVLTNSRGILSHTGIPEPKFPYLYQLLLDYYVANTGNVVFKRHPYGLIHYTGKIPGISNLNGLLPIEFIALFRDVRIKNVLAAESTSVNKIGPYVDNVIAAGMVYYRNQHFLMLHQLYVTYSLVEAIGDHNINFCQTINPDFLQRYLRYVFPQYNSKKLNSVDPNVLNGKIFTVVDCCPSTEEADICDGLQNAGKDAITVFLNRNNSFDFYDAGRPELLDQMIPVKITKTALRDDILENLSDEYIYVFSKDPEVREKVRAFSMSKPLYYTGIEIKVAPLEDAAVDLIKMGIRLGSMRRTLKKIIDRFAKLQKDSSSKDSGVDSTMMKGRVEDMETALREVVNCLTDF